MNPVENVYSADELRNLGYFARLRVPYGANRKTVDAAFTREQTRYHKLITEGKSEFTECYFLLEEAYNGLISQLPEEPYVAPVRKVAEPGPSPAPKRPVTLVGVIVQVLIFVLCNLLVFWWRYSASPESSPLLTGIICAVTGIFAAVRFSKSGREDYAGRTVLLMIMLCVNVAITHSKFQRQWFYLDNRNAFEVVIKVDGEPIDTLYNFEWNKNSVRPGEHTIEACKIPGDSLVEKFDVSVSVNNPCLYNVLSSGEYMAGTESYFENPTYAYLSGVSAYDYPNIAIKERWVNLNYDYIFESAPAEISWYKTPFSSGHETAERTYIVRKTQ